MNLHPLSEQIGGRLGEPGELGCALLKAGLRLQEPLHLVLADGSALAADLSR